MKKFNFKRFLEVFTINLFIIGFGAFLAVISFCILISLPWLFSNAPWAVVIGIIVGLIIISMISYKDY